MDQWRLSKANFARYTPAINHENQLHFAKIKFLSNLPGANELSTAMKYDIQQQNNILPKSDSVTSLTGTINNSNKHGDTNQKHILDYLGWVHQRMILNNGNTDNKFWQGMWCGKTAVNKNQLAIYNAWMSVSQEPPGILMCQSELIRLNPVSGISYLNHLEICLISSQEIVYISNSN